MNNKIYYSSILKPLLVPSTRLRENELTNQESNSGTNNPLTRLFFSNENNLVGSTNIINTNSNNLINREGSIYEFSNFNFNAYSDLTGNNYENNSDSGYGNRNFDSHLDEIFDNLTYLITTEK